MRVRTLALSALLTAASQASSADIPPECQLDAVTRHHAMENAVRIEFVCPTRDLVSVVPHLILGPLQSELTPPPPPSCDIDQDGSVTALDLAACRAQIEPVVP